MYRDPEYALKLLGDSPFGPLERKILVGLKESNPNDYVGALVPNFLLIIALTSNDSNTFIGLHAKKQSTSLHSLLSIINLESSCISKI